MKKLILGALIAVFVFGAHAQDQERTQKTPEEIATFRVEQLKKKIALSETQVASVKTAMVSSITKTREVREKFAGDREAMKNAMQPIRTEFQNSMKATLTQEQFQQWTEIRKKKMAQAKQKKADKPHMHQKEKHENKEQKQLLEEK